MLQGEACSPTPQAVQEQRRFPVPTKNPLRGGTVTLEPTSMSSRHGPGQRAGLGAIGAEDVAGGRV